MIYSILYYDLKFVKVNLILDFGENEPHIDLTCMLYLRCKAKEIKEMEKETVCDVVNLNAFKHNMFNFHQAMASHTYSELMQAREQISEKVNLIRHFLKLKDKCWSLEMAWAGLEFSKSEQYKQLRECGTEYSSYYRILTDLLIIREGIKNYIESHYTNCKIDIEQAKKVIQALEEYNDSIEWADTYEELTPVRNTLRLLNDIVTSTGVKA